MSLSPCMRKWCSFIEGLPPEGCRSPDFSSSGRAVGGGDEMRGCALHREEEKMKIVRRQFLHLAAASIDAPVVRRLRTAGAVIVAKTNMVEFAFSGIGLNPHYGTPGNPADRMRVPGGSSSGAAVAVADGMCEIAIGTDTGGSTRIPAAFCGVVGYKPTKSRVPTEGAFPLSYTLDSVGPIAKSVAACAAADAVMAGDDPWGIEPAPLQGLRLGIPQGLPLRDLDQAVAARFSDAAKELARAGMRLSAE